LVNLDKFRGIDIFGWFPGIMFGPIAFPFDKILLLTPKHSVIQNFFHLVIHVRVVAFLDWWRDLSIWEVDRRILVKHQTADMEYVVHRKRGGQL